MSVLILDTCIFHVFVQQVLQVLLLVIVELSLQSQQDVFVQQHPDQVERACQCQNVRRLITLCIRVSNHKDLIPAQPLLYLLCDL